MLSAGAGAGVILEISWPSFLMPGRKTTTSVTVPNAAASAAQRIIGPRSPPPRRCYAGAFRRGFFRGQREGGDLAAVRALAEVIQQLGALPFRKSLLHKCREQIGVRMVGALKSILDPKEGRPI